MSVFRIEPEKLDKYIGEFAEIDTEISNVKIVLSEVKKDAMFSNHDYKGIRDSLEEIEFELENARKVCAKLADVLDYSKQAYVNTEKRLIEAFENPERLISVDIPGIASEESDDNEDSLVENIVNAILNSVCIVDVDIDALRDNLFDAVNSLSDKQILTLFELLESAPLSIVTELQYEVNKQAWEQYKEDYTYSMYIEQQSKLTGLQYGTANKFEEWLFFGDEEMTAAKNTCEVIAVYNALSYLEDGNPQVDFPELLRDFSDDGIVLNGVWGTSPTSLQEYMDDLGYDTRMFYDDDINESTLNTTEKRYDTYILTAYNEAGDITHGVHTVSITCEEDGKYYIHNNGDATPYASLYDAVTGFNSGKGDAISVIAIK